MTVQRTFEMAISREEFFRFLSAALGAYETDGRIARGIADGHRWTIVLAPLPGGLSGGLVVPRHQVEITIDGCTDAEGAAVMERFHRAFLRGGG